MEIGLALLFFCFGPLAFIFFGYWIGRGAPGWPWRVVRRDAETETRSPYYEKEVYQ